MEHRVTASVAPGAHEETSAPQTDRLAHAKAALMSEFGLHRHVANEVALEYLRLLDFRAAVGPVELPDDTLLQRFEDHARGPMPCLSPFSPLRGEAPVLTWEQWPQVYQQRYGQALPMCWLAGSASGLDPASDATPTVGQRLLRTTALDPAPTGQCVSATPSVPEGP